MATRSDQEAGETVPEPSPDRSGPTADQLRSDIDGGRTGDKVPGSDPAAAPLGTDAEAAGDPPSAAEVAGARRREGGRGEPAAARKAPRSRTLAFWVVLALAVVIGLGLLAL